MICVCSESQACVVAGSRSGRSAIVPTKIALHPSCRDERGYDFPVTQSELGDAMGTSMVHANRVLQELRGNGLITWQGSTVSIQDCIRRDFDPAYLHQRVL